MKCSHAPRTRRRHPHDSIARRRDGGSTPVDDPCDPQLCGSDRQNGLGVRVNRLTLPLTVGVDLQDDVVHRVIGPRVRVVGRGHFGDAPSVTSPLRLQPGR